MVAIITPAEFKVRFPEFTGVDDLTIQAIIDEAVLFLMGYSGSASYKVLQFFLVAHNVFVQREAAKGGDNSDGSSSNPTTNKTVGNVSQSFAASATSPGNEIVSFWNSSSYGQQFYVYLKQARYRMAPFGLI